VQLSCLADRTIDDSFKFATDIKSTVFLRQSMFTLQSTKTINLFSFFVELGGWMTRSMSGSTDGKIILNIANANEKCTSHHCLGFLKVLIFVSCSSMNWSF
jgi:hypothetical protein